MLRRALTSKVFDASALTFIEEYRVGGPVGASMVHGSDWAGSCLAWWLSRHMTTALNERKVAGACIRWGVPPAERPTVRSGLFPKPVPEMLVAGVMPADNPGVCRQSQTIPASSIRILVRQGFVQRIYVQATRP